MLASVYTIGLLYGHLGGMWVFKEFSFAVASFHPSWSCSGFWLAYKRLALPSVLLVNVWDLAVSLSAYTSKIFPRFWWEGRRGWALLVLAFFFTDYTENAVVLTSGLSVLLASNNAVLFWSAAIRMHCETTGVWLKVVFSPMFGVVIVEGKSIWVMKAECWGNFCSFKHSCLWLKPSTFCCAFR